MQTTHSTTHSRRLPEGYCLLAQRLSGDLLAQLDVECQRLTDKASAILQHIQGQTYAEFYARGSEHFIAVPEADNPLQTCRFEYISASSDFIKNQIVPLCAQAIREKIGSEVLLFKDKCNLKSPGGGAFTPHQDIPAYIDFGPKVHITAAVFLDDATAENGALEMASNLTELQGQGLQYVDTPLGQLPILATAVGGKHNGRIVEHLEQQLHWLPVYAKAGDIILFDSYIPHRSATNHSTATRRAFFFTFNLSEDGNCYEAYYQSKRADFGNLRFHVATPTAHNGM